MSNRDSPRVSLSSLHLPESELITLCDDERRKPEVNLSHVEVISEDSGFEPSPKLSESGSELMGSHVKQTYPEFFGELDQENNVGSAPRLPSLLLTPSDMEHDLAILDNDVFDFDLTRERQLKTTKRHVGEGMKCKKLWTVYPKYICRSKSFAEISETVLYSEHSFTRQWLSNPNLTTQSTTSAPPEKNSFPAIFSTSIQESRTNLKPCRKERRKAVVKPPTLALDNDTYLALGATFRQLPPPILIPRRSRAMAVSDDAVYSRRSSAISSDSTEKENQRSFLTDSDPTKNGKSEGIFHRVLVEVHQPQSSSLNQESTTGSFSRHQTAPSLVNPAAAFNPIRDIQSSSPGKVVERGNRKFIRPQDISIQQPDNGAYGTNTGVLNTNANLSNAAHSGKYSEISKVSGISCKQLSSSPRMTVSPVRYVHFQFPSVSPNNNHKRSLSEDNILACAAYTEEFPGFPKTMRNLTLLNETSTALPGSALSWSGVSSPVRMRNQAVGITGHGYIPVRRFSDPSSLPVCIDSSDSLLP